MTATILFVDDEPDLEALVLQKFRRQIRDGAVQFMFAHDGIEGLQSIEGNPHVDMVAFVINMPRMDVLLLLQKPRDAEDTKSTIIVADMTDVVFAHEGKVAKMIGDAIQILVNAPGDQSDYATRAVACARELDVWAEGFRERWKSKGVNCGATRIGVHAGPALVGNFGGSRFFDYTAYGDTVNIAARLEGANKFLGTRICVSAPLAEAPDAFQGRPVGDLMLRGRSEPLRAYEPLSVEAFKGLATAQYSEAFAKLVAGDAAAMPAFAALVGSHADDALAGFHLRRLLSGVKGVRMQLECANNRADGRHRGRC